MAGCKSVSPLLLSKLRTEPRPICFSVVIHKLFVIRLVFCYFMYVNLIFWCWIGFIHTFNLNFWSFLFNLFMTYNVAYIMQDNKRFVYLLTKCFWDAVARCTRNRLDVFNFVTMKWTTQVRHRNKQVKTR